MDLVFVDDPLTDVRRLYRQAYLAHLAGEPLETIAALGTALRAEIGRLPPSAVDDPSFVVVFAEERRRIDDARVLGDLMVPRLREGLRAERSAAPGIAGSPSPAAAAAPAATRPADLSGAATPAVADLLDAMLLQDSARARR